MEVLLHGYYLNFVSFFTVLAQKLLLIRKLRKWFTVPEYKTFLYIQ